MPYLRHRTTGAVTDLLAADSMEYRTLTQMRLTADATSAANQAAITGEEAGGTYTIKAGQPVWEDVAWQNAGEPDPATGRVFAIYISPATIAASETTNGVELTNVAGTLTDVEYVPVAAITGANTNNRVITLNQVAVTGTSSPARAVTALAAVTFASGTNGAALVGTALTISQASFNAVPPETLEVVSSVNGSGMVDPGGVLYAVYTRA